VSNEEKTPNKLNELYNCPSPDRCNVCRGIVFEGLSDHLSQSHWEILAALGLTELYGYYNLLDALLLSGNRYTLLLIRQRQ
jgi:hypothetical protein